MTRNEALERAICIVEKSRCEDAGEICEMLTRCIRAIRKRKWNEEAIFAYCDEVVAKNGRLLMGDLVGKGCPHHTDITQVFKMTGAEFRDKYYGLDGGISPLSPYFRKSVEEWTELFVEDYLRIQPRSRRDYDKKRAAGLPRGKVITRMRKADSWQGLLISLGLDGPKVQEELACSSTSDSAKQLIAIGGKAKLSRVSVIKLDTIP